MNPANPSSVVDRGPKKRGRASGSAAERHNLIQLDDLLPELADRIRKDLPELTKGALISRQEVARYRKLYVEELLNEEHGDLTELDRRVAESLVTGDTIAEDVESDYEEQRTLGERFADQLSEFGGSWTFIVWFIAAMAGWIALNQLVPDQGRFDPYPYILLNLGLSCLAALQAPVIMMSQKRQEAKDRLRSQNDYRVNLKAELEIRHLHEKIDHLISRQWQRLAQIQQMQLDIMQEIEKH